MAMTIHVDIVSAEAEIFSGLAEMVFAPAIEGEVGIAPRHAPMMTALSPGEVRLYTEGEEEKSFYISGGMLEVQPHVITVLSDTAERAENLDEAAALEAKKKAEENIKNRDAELDLALAQSQLAEAVAQLQAIQRLRKRS